MRHGNGIASVAQEPVGEAGVTHIVDCRSQQYGKLFGRLETVEEGWTTLDQTHCTVNDVCSMCIIVIRVASFVVCFYKAKKTVPDRSFHDRAEEFPPRGCSIPNTAERFPPK